MFSADFPIFWKSDGTAPPNLISQIIYEKAKWDEFSYNNS